MTQEIRKQEKSVCAWCRSEYDQATGKRTRPLTDAEYALVLSHGCCPECWHKMLAGE